MDIEPRTITTINVKSLSITVAAVICINGLSENKIALPKYSPILAGVNEPAENP